MSIFQSIYWLPVVGFIALGILLALMAVINGQEDTLPEPRMDCVDKGPLEHWEAGDGHVRTP